MIATFVNLFYLKPDLIVGGLMVNEQSIGMHNSIHMYPVQFPVQLKMLLLKQWKFGIVGYIEMVIV